MSIDKKKQRHHFLQRRITKNCYEAGVAPASREAVKSGGKPILEWDVQLFQERGKSFIVKNMMRDICMYQICVRRPS